MRLDQDDIKNLIIIHSAKFSLAEFLSRQELDRLVDIFYGILINFEVEENTIFETWENIVKSKLHNDIEEYQDYFGIKDIYNKINLLEFFKQVFFFETKQDLNKVV